MYTLRCTQALLKKLKKHYPPVPVVPEPTTVLGNWYAKPYNLGRLRMILCTSERSLLTVIVPAKDLSKLSLRLAEAVARMLIYLDVDTGQVAQERRAMDESQIAPTVSRSVLGTMNDMAHLADCHIAEEGAEVDLDQVALQLNEAPCGLLLSTRTLYSPAAAPATVSSFAQSSKNWSRHESSRRDQRSSVFPVSVRARTPR
jgi:hypothetical protein